ncbi:diguanylate cyclase [Actinoplanes sp. N902-109]|uniref:GGDEF domain-containing protein n=1 Tax=Actinoplanes sp. (strain N902-109) TaxID=649831 RepID=UPI000329357B|nr:GGDEF domain-containing protein [Actinoplanes sp. N902-109]AGL14186.1 diguanylate cyclase [Actinoplanes sp. N902-109]
MKLLRRLPLWQWWLLAGAGVGAAYLAMPSNSPWSWAVYNLFGFAAAVVVVVGVRRNKPQRVGPWYCFAAALLLWALGDVTYEVQYFALDWDSFPAPADVPYLLAYPVFAAGCYRLIRGRISGRDRAGLLDAAVVSTGLSLLTWSFLMRPIAVDDSMGVLQRLVSLAYPAGDLLLLIMVVRLFTTPGARTASYRLLVTAIVAQLVSDIGYAVINMFTVYTDGVLDAGWILMYLLWGAAALHPSMRTLSETAPDRAERFSAGRLVLLATASLLAPAVLAVQGFTDPASIDWPAIVIGSVVLFLLVVLRMGGLVARIQDQAAQLRALAHNDPLTGLPNRRAWDLELSREMAKAVRGHDEVVVAMLDLDHFKRYNDTLGHPAGDRLLKEAAAAWRDRLRPADLLARYGGEEFVVLLTEVSMAEAVGLLERMLAATPHGQTFSAGVARWDGSEIPEQLVGRADRALYQAKHDGRGRVAAADPVEPVLPRRVGQVVEEVAGRREEQRARHRR